jgi:hypothetical protein
MARKNKPTEVSVIKPLRVCYADPPYLGYGHKNNSVYHYGDLHAEAADYDRLETHVALVQRLLAEFPDGWALSLSTPSLKDLLPVCPRDCRVGAWVKPFCSFKSNVNPAYAWEPVIWRGGRKPPRYLETVRDYCSASITLQTSCPGAKPEAFCMWIFRLLGLQPEDDFVDLFPGSGNVGLAWEAYKRCLTGLFAPALLSEGTS